jgi:hypothetical protein
MFTKRVVAKPGKGVKNLTKPASVFYITDENIYKTSEAIYHNVGNGNLKLFSLGFVPQNLKKPHFTKRVQANNGGEVSLSKGRDRGFLLEFRI